MISISASPTQLFYLIGVCGGMETFSSPDKFFLGVISTLVLQERKDKDMNELRRSNISHFMHSLSCYKEGLLRDTYTSALTGLRVSSPTKNSRASKSLLLW